MNAIKFAAVSVLALVGASSVSLADFADGQTITVNGYSGPQQPGNWGTAQGQGPHALGGSTNFWDSFWGSPSNLTVGVSSTVNNANSLTLTVDYSAFEPEFYSNLWIDVLDLKTDGSIIGVTASQGIATINADGNGFHWDGSIGLNDSHVVTFNITQSPTPGAAALMGVGILASARRRRV